jgi:tetratricopeptide (TPR) repeat protein
MLDRYGKYGFLIMITLAAILYSCGSQPPEVQFEKARSKGDKLAEENRCKDAVKEYHKAIKINDRVSSTYRKIANCFLKMEMIDSAVTYYEGAIIHNPRDIKAYQDVGDIYFNRQMYHEAMTWYDRALQIGHISAQSYVKLGRIHQSWGENDMAKNYFDLALAADSTNNEALFGVAAIAWIQGDTTTAIADYRKAAEDGPNALAAYRLGMIYANQKKYNDALEWLDKCMKLEPDSELSAEAYQSKMEIIVRMKEGQK